MGSSIDVPRVIGGPVGGKTAKTIEPVGTKTVEAVGTTVPFRVIFVLIAAGSGVATRLVVVGCG